MIATTTATNVFLIVGTVIVIWFAIEWILEVRRDKRSRFSQPLYVPPEWSEPNDEDYVELWR